MPKVVAEKHRGGSAPYAKPGGSSPSPSKKSSSGASPHKSNNRTKKFHRMNQSTNHKGGHPQKQQQQQQQAPQQPQQQPQQSFVATHPKTSKGTVNTNWQAVLSSNPEIKTKIAAHQRFKDVTQAAAKSAAESKAALDASGPKTKVPLPTGTALVSAHATSTMAIDCEMVGAGPKGSRSLLGRVSIVNEAGAVVLDSYVAPVEEVTDYRTRFSGIRPRNLIGAPEFDVIQGKVRSLLANKVVVGHDVKNDFAALKLTHPRHLIRDTARYPPLLNPNGRPMALRALARKYLGQDIQEGEHSSVDDARACLAVYLLHKHEWEKSAKALQDKKDGKTGTTSTSAPSGLPKHHPAQHGSKKPMSRKHEPLF